MKPFSKKWPALILLMHLSSPAPAAQECPLVGPNYLMDPDFALESKDPLSPHWKAMMHAGADAYRTEIAEGELTIRKIAPQEWFNYQQRVSVADKHGVKMAFSAELKLDMKPPADALFSIDPSGGLDITVRSASDRIIWSSERNHEPRLGKTEWEKVQVVFVVPARAQKLDLGFTHYADGTLQVRKPSFRKVDETAGPCPVTPDRSSSYENYEETPLR